MNHYDSYRKWARTSGFTVVEVMVALLIGLLSVYAVYSVYARFDRANRATASINETQMSGLHSMFLLEQTIADAGSAMMHKDVFDELLNCKSSPIPVMPGGSSTTAVNHSVFPLPAVIQSKVESSPARYRRDQIYLFSGTSSRYLGAVHEPKKNTIPKLEVGANTYKLPIALRKNDVLVAQKAKSCEAFSVREATPIASGNQTVTLSRLDVGSAGMASTGPNHVFNLGAVSRYHFYINANRELVMEQYPLGQETPESSMVIASEVYVFAAQYGIDTDDDNVIDMWVNGWEGDNGSTATKIWRPNEVFRFEQLDLGDAKRYIKAVKAIRVGAIMRVDEPEHDTESPSAIDGTKTLTLFSDPTPVSSNPPLPIEFTYQVRDANNMVYRYRAYEAVIPLRNVVWNPLYPKEV